MLHVGTVVNYYDILLFNNKLEYVRDFIQALNQKIKLLFHIIFNLNAINLLLLIY